MRARHRHLAAEPRAARVDMALDALHIARRAEQQLARQAAAVERQPAREAALDDIQRAGRARAAHVDPREGDLRGAAGGQEDIARRLERPQPRAAGGGEGEALRGRIEMRAHLRQPHRGVGRSEQQVDRRMVDLPVELERQRAVARLRAPPLEMETAVAAAIAGAREAQRWRGEDQVGEMQHAVRRPLQRGADARQATGEAAEEGVVEPHHPRLALPDDAGAMPARPRHDAQGGGDVDHAEAGDQIAPERAVDADLIVAGREIEQQIDPPGELVRLHAQIVAGDELAGDAQHAVDRQVAQHAARHVAHPGHARGGEMDRQADRRFRETTLPRRPRLIEAGVVEGEAGRGEAIIETGGGEGPVEHRAQFHVASGHVREQGGGLEQSRAQADVAESARAEIERAGGVHRQRRRAQREIARQPPVGERRAAVHRDTRRGQSSELATRHRRGDEIAGERIGALAVAERQVDHARAAGIGKRMAVPARPAPRAADLQPQRLADAAEPRQHAILHATRADGDVEPVAIRLGVDPQPQRVAALHHRREIDQRAPGMDIGAAPDAAIARDPGDAAIDIQAIDPQPPDANIEIGKQRPLLRARPGMGPFGEGRGGDIQRGDVEPVGEPAQRRPAQPGDRRGENETVEIVDAHVAQHRAAVDRPVDPPDREAQPARRAHRRDPVRHPAVPHVGIDHQHRRAEDRQRGRDKPGDPLRRPPQNACPSET